jgi:hypothetical protein
MALKNRLQFQTVGAASLYGSGPARFGVEHGVARALAVPSDGFNLQHCQPIISSLGQDLPKRNGPICPDSLPNPFVRKISKCWFRGLWAGLSQVMESFRD